MRFRASLRLTSLQPKDSNPRLVSSLRDNKDEDTLRLDLVEDEMLKYAGGGIICVKAC